MLYEQPLLRGGRGEEGLSSSSTIDGLVHWVNCTLLPGVSCAHGAEEQDKRLLAYTRLLASGLTLPTLECCAVGRGKTFSGRWGWAPCEAGTLTHCQQQKTQHGFGVRRAKEGEVGQPLWCLFLAASLCSPFLLAPWPTL